MRRRPAVPISWFRFLTPKRHFGPLGFGLTLETAVSVSVSPRRGFASSPRAFGPLRRKSRKALSGARPAPGASRASSVGNPFLGVGFKENQEKEINFKKNGGGGGGGGIALL